MFTHPPEENNKKTNQCLPGIVADLGCFFVSEIEASGALLLCILAVMDLLWYTKRHTNKVYGFQHAHCKIYSKEKYTTMCFWVQTNHTWYGF